MLLFLTAAATAAWLNAGSPAPEPSINRPDVSAPDVHAPGTAALPPKYLSVPAFKRCLATQSKGSYQVWCLPASRPEACPRSSWASLTDLQGPDQLPACASAVDAAPPASAASSASAHTAQPSQHRKPQP